MSAPYQRHHASRSRGGQGTRSPLPPSTQWAGSGRGQARTSGAGLHASEESLLSSQEPEDRTRNANRTPGWALLARRIRRFSVRQVSIFAVLAFVIFSGAWVIRRDMKYLGFRDVTPVDAYFRPIPELPAIVRAEIESTKPKPVQWLRDSTHITVDPLSSEEIRSLQPTRPKAAFVALVRSSELAEMLDSISHIEARFNSRITHRYDWVFFSNEEFTEEFKAAATNATSSQCYFELIPPDHWEIPSWTDKSRFNIGRQFHDSIGIGKAWLESYYRMCRWSSGLFALEKRLATYNYYWRVKAGVKYKCDVNYDVFQFMQDNDIAYGFNVAVIEDQRVIPSLWDRTREFVLANMDMVDDKAHVSWLLGVSEDEDDVAEEDVDTRLLLADREYSNCQFYSNFEVGSLDFFRSKEHQAYFDHIGKNGAFHYGRRDDAPIHNMSVTMFLPQRRVWFFRDIGCARGLCQQCPPHEPKAYADLMADVRRNSESLARSSSEGTPKIASDEPPKSRSKEVATVPGKEVSTELKIMAATHRLWEIMSRDVGRQQRLIPVLACGCTVTHPDEGFSKLVTFESKQRKPSDTCIRRWLGGERLEKKPGWTRQAEIAAGGGGYGGCVLDGLLVNPFTEPSECQPDDGTPNSTFVVADAAADYDAVVEAFRGCDAVIHLAAIPDPVGKPDHVVHANNVNSAFNGLRAAGELGIKRFCYASSVNAIGLAYANQPLRFPYFPIDEDYPPNPTDAYALAKREAEVAAAAMANWFPGMRIACLRIHEVEQRGPVKQEHAENWKDAAVSQLWGWVSPAATARACLLAVTNPRFEGCQIFNIVAPDTTQDDTPSEELVRKYYPDAEIRGDLGGNRGFWTTDKAERMLGWRHEEKE
ncbi:hypothetical protein DL764_000547 [Monosporascus ibericus]|uniref:NAD-dependent epimerase/dehydratase domain-containing protein n=1 Tax=Monosporascus ibericus TaxID=155417 RepID=A0A4Q4TWD4_9PEZI|nr:hypothetical protein DL764_000547 [Monosporascus ibericus]